MSVRSSGIRYRKRPAWLPATLDSEIGDAARGDSPFFADPVPPPVRSRTSPGRSRGPLARGDRSGDADEPLRPVARMDLGEPARLLSSARFHSWPSPSCAGESRLVERPRRGGGVSCGPEHSSWTVPNSCGARRFSWETEAPSALTGEHDGDPLRCVRPPALISTVVLMTGTIAEGISVSSVTQGCVRRAVAKRWKWRSPGRLLIRTSTSEDGMARPLAKDPNKYTSASGTVCWRTCATFHTARSSAARRACARAAYHRANARSSFPSRCASRASLALRLASRGKK